MGFPRDGEVRGPDSVYRAETTQETCRRGSRMRGGAGHVGTAAGLTLVGCFAPDSALELNEFFPSCSCYLGNLAKAGAAA